MLIWNSQEFLFFFIYFFIFFIIHRNSQELMGHPPQEPEHTNYSLKLQLKMKLFFISDAYIT